MGRGAQDDLLKKKIGLKKIHKVESSRGLPSVAYLDPLNDTLTMASNHGETMAAPGRGPDSVAFPWAP